MLFEHFILTEENKRNAICITLEVQSAAQVEPGGAYCIACSFFPYGIKERI